MRGFPRTDVVTTFLRKSNFLTASSRSSRVGVCICSSPTGVHGTTFLQTDQYIVNLFFGERMTVPSRNATDFSCDWP